MNNRPKYILFFSAKKERISISYEDKIVSINKKNYKKFIDIMDKEHRKIVMDFLRDKKSLRKLFI